MTEKNLREYLNRSGAILKGHFLLSSGKHSDNYIQCALALKNPRKAAILGKCLKKLWRGKKPDLILSPAMGGLIIGHETAKAFGCDFIFLERVGGKLLLRRSFKIKTDANIIIVEDVFTTGKSTMETFAVAEKEKGKVLGALSIVDRMGKRKFPFPSKSLLKLRLKTYPPSACPLCAGGIPIEKPGSRRGRKEI